MRKHTFAAGLFLTASLLNVSHADTWASPQPRIFSSENGDRSLMVLPSRTVPRDGAATPATGIWIQLSPDGKERKQSQIKLLNTPMRVLIPDESVGFFVTLDNYGHLGYEHTMVIYRSNGEVVRDLKLEELLSAREIGNIQHSVSSRWWRERAVFSFEYPETRTVTKNNDHDVVFVTRQPEDTRLVIRFPWGIRKSVRLGSGEVLQPRTIFSPAQLAEGIKRAQQNTAPAQSKSK